MKFVNLKTGEIAFGSQYYNSIEKPHTYNYNEKEGKFELSEWVEIDDQMVAPIIVLNRKGYETEWSCAGHVYESLIASYVRFKEPIFRLQELMLDSKYILDPNIFSIESDYKTVRINDLYKDESDPLIAQRLMNRFCEELLEWAMKIPDRKDCKGPLPKEEKKLTPEEETGAYCEALDYVK